MMKKLMVFAVCVMAVMIGCKNKGQTDGADAKDSLEAIIDSIIEENDTTPLPMFLIGNDGEYMQMLYFTNLKEPDQKKYEEECGTLEGFEPWHKRWELQEMFRRNAAQYTNMLLENKITKIKFIDEVLKDPDGEEPSTGEIHARPEIPALCARFDFVNPKEKRSDLGWGVVICTDSYLNSRKMLDMKSCQKSDYTYPKLPAEVVKQLEKEYGMKVKSTMKSCIIGDRYTMGAVEFEGEYKNAPKDKHDPDRKYALALEVLLDSGKVYKMEQLGYYDEQYGCAWNAEADGYIPNDLAAAFEGPKGLELCYTHGAPESFGVGMIYLRDGKMIEHEYEFFHSMVDEEMPVWKSDLAMMENIFEANRTSDEHVELVKWAHCYIDYHNEWIWLRDKDDKNGAFFIRKDDGKIKLVAVEDPRHVPSKAEKDGMYYLKFAGHAGGPATLQDIYAFNGEGKQLWKLSVLEVYGEISEAYLNEKEITVGEGQTYLNQVPEGKEITAFFKEYKVKEK